MTHPRRIIVAVLGYAAWTLCLYFIATTSNLAFLASGAISGGVAIPATWWAMQSPHGTSVG